MTKPEEIFEKAYRHIQKGILYEKKSMIDYAIIEYEQAIKLKFEGNHPYDRLAILYRKRKDLKNEIRVLKSGIAVFSKLMKTSKRTDVPVKLESFIKRLEKIT